MFLSGKNFYTGFTDGLEVLNKDIYDRNSYSHNCQLAEYLIKQLNGVVNKVIMAKHIGFITDYRYFGSSLFNSININVHSIMQEKTVEAFDTRLFYTIVHELLHVDQNMRIPKVMAFNGMISEEEIAFINEVSCHAMTLYYIENLKSVFSWLDIDLKLCKKYVLDAINFQYEKSGYKIKNKVGDIKQYANSYYRWTSPLDAALFMIEDEFLSSYNNSENNATKGMTVDDIIKRYNIQNLYLIVYSYNTLINFDLIYSNGNYVNPERIFNVLNIFSLLEDYSTISVSKWINKLSKMYFNHSAGENDWGFAINIKSMLPDISIAYHV